MTRQYTTVALVLGASVFLGVLTIAAQDRSAVAIPDGLAFSDFKGYDAWQTIAPSYTDDGVKAIVGNPVMIRAYQAGFGNGTPVPDGAMMAKIEWSTRRNTVSPYPVTVPGELKSVAFMIKDAKRFPASGGWGYAQFKYDPAAKTFTPNGTGSACGYACHTRVKDHDYVFTEYGRR
jgi:cytochrome P460